MGIVFSDHTCVRCGFLEKLGTGCSVCDGVTDEKLAEHIIENGDKCSVYVVSKIMLRDIFKRLRKLEGWREFDG